MPKGAPSFFADMAANPFLERGLWVASWRASPAG